MAAAEKGKKVHIHYTGTFDDGTVFDSSEGRDPLVFEVGAKQVIAGFDAAVTGMQVGERRTFRLEPKDAYGQHNPQLVQEVPKEALGELKDQVKENMILGVHHPAVPQQIPARVVKVTAETVTIDLNPPLAGKPLNFAIELVWIE